MAPDPTTTTRTETTMSADHPAGHPDAPPTHPDDAAPGNPYIRWRTKKRTRHVPHTPDGVNTEMVEQTYYVRVPVPPRDWDLILHRTLTGLALVMVTVSVVWSTASIGGLLAVAVPAVIAYAAAITFDAAWIGCMIAEWLARYDPERAQFPRRAGNIALVAAMTAVGAHGYLIGGDAGIAAGVIGAVISALAKGLWIITIRATSHPLDPLTQQWLARRKARIQAQLALTGAERRLLRLQGQQAALATASGLPPSAPAGQADTDGGQPSRTVVSAVRAARAVMPRATPQEIAAHLADHLRVLDVEVDADTVADILSADNPAPADTPDKHGDVVRPINTVTGRGATDTVREALAAGITDPAAVVAYVQEKHAPTPVKGESIKRILRRAQEQAARRSGA
jgi:hypothetical protein